MKRVLVITPRFPYPEAGACEQDRADGIRQLTRLGCEVRVIGKYFDWQNPDEIISHWQKEGVAVTLVPYRKKSAKGVSWILDGAAAEYKDPAMRKAIENIADEFHPDTVWLDYTYLWPLYGLFKKRGMRILVRSINFEALHYLDEDGRSLSHWLKAMPKFASECITAWRADMLFAITPAEETQYRRIFSRRVATLPLRSLYKKLGTHTPRETDTFHVFFFGSTYNVSHNRRALEFLVKEVAPRAKKEYGDAFVFHIFGAKLPEDVRPYIKDNVVAEGFVENLDMALGGMDIATVPSLFGRGMQQKIFEPLARGFPTITHTRGIMGYPFAQGEEYLSAETAEDFVRALGDLRSIDKRRMLSENCKKKSEVLFNQRALDEIVMKAL